MNYNRFGYCYGNPFKYIDPSGEFVWFIPIIIGAVIGATTGAILASQAHAQGFWQWAGYIGGGWGAFAGGVASNFSNQILYENGDFSRVNWLTVAASGVLSYGSYELMSYIGWITGGNKLGKFDIKYNQYKTMQADIQRSMFWHKEYGGILTTDGNVVRAPSQYRHSMGVDFDPQWTSDATGRILTHYHTHWSSPNINYTIDANLEIADYGYSATSSNGPSQYDQTFAKNTNFNGILIDRASTYYYGNYQNNTIVGNFSNSFSLNLGSVFTRFFFFPYFNNQ